MKHKKTKIRNSSPQKIVDPIRAGSKRSANLFDPTPRKRKRIYNKIYSHPDDGFKGFDEMLVYDHEGGLTIFHGNFTQGSGETVTTGKEAAGGIVSFNGRFNLSEDSEIISPCFLLVKGAEKHPIYNTIEGPATIWFKTADSKIVRDFVNFKDGVAFSNKAQRRFINYDDYTFFITEGKNSSHALLGQTTFVNEGIPITNTTKVVTEDKRKVFRIDTENDIIKFIPPMRPDDFRAEPGFRVHLRADENKWDEICYKFATFRGIVADDNKPVAGICELASGIKINVRRWVNIKDKLSDPSVCQLIGKDGKTVLGYIPYKNIDFERGYIQFSHEVCESFLFDFEELYNKTLAENFPWEVLPSKKADELAANNNKWLYTDSQYVEYPKHSGEFMRGNGAKKFTPKNTLNAIYPGISDKPEVFYSYANRMRELGHDHPYIYAHSMHDCSSDTELDAFPQQQTGALFNHAEKKNANVKCNPVVISFADRGLKVAVWKRAFYATRDIYRAEPLLYYYGNRYQFPDKNKGKAKSKNKGKGKISNTRKKTALEVLKRMQSGRLSLDQALRSIYSTNPFQSIAQIVASSFILITEEHSKLGHQFVNTKLLKKICRDFVNICKNENNWREIMDLTFVLYIQHGLGGYLKQIMSNVVKACSNSKLRLKNKAFGTSNKKYSLPVMSRKRLQKYYDEAQKDEDEYDDEEYTPPPSKKRKATKRKKIRKKKKTKSVANSQKVDLNRQKKKKNKKRRKRVTKKQPVQKPPPLRRSTEYTPSLFKPPPENESKNLINSNMPPPWLRKLPEVPYETLNMPRESTATSLPLLGVYDRYTKTTTLYEDIPLDQITANDELQFIPKEQIHHNHLNPLTTGPSFFNSTLHHPTYANNQQYYGQYDTYPLIY